MYMGIPVAKMLDRDIVMNKFKLNYVKFCKDGLDFTQPTKVDLPLTKKPNQTMYIQELLKEFYV